MAPRSQRSARAEERWNVMTHCYVGKKEGEREEIFSGLFGIIEVHPSAVVACGVWECSERGRKREREKERKEEERRK